MKLGGGLAVEGSAGWTRGAPEGAQLKTSDAGGNEPHQHDRRGGGGAPCQARERRAIDARAAGPHARARGALAPRPSSEPSILARRRCAYSSFNFLSRRSSASAIRLFAVASDTAHASATSLSGCCSTRASTHGMRI